MGSCLLLRYWLLTLCALGALPVVAQTAEADAHTWQGVVVDSLTGEGLSFAVVRTLQGQEGAVADVEGRFRLSLPFRPDSLEVSYIGYQTRRVAVWTDTLARIWLSARMHETETVVVEAGENPALALIRGLVANRRTHHPRSYDAYNYVSYNKLTATINPKYSLNKEADSVLKLMKLLVWETTTRRNYIRPYRDFERVEGSHFSGLPGMAVPFSPSMVQDISFYTDWIKVMEQEFLSPISFAALKRYRYLLTDSLITGGDTLYTIQFFPNENFARGMAGELRMTKRDYALVHIAAEIRVPEDIDLWLRFHIQQQHEKIDGEKWFPTQLYTEAHFQTNKVRDAPEQFFILDTRTYLDSITFEPDPNLAATNIELDIDEGAGKQKETYWQQYRRDSLAVREQTTYQKMDSIGEKYKLALLVRQLNKVALGYIDLGVVDLSLPRLLRFNRVENTRVGLGLRTNEQISRNFSVGGWVGYGTGDSQWKYGGSLHLHPFRNPNFRLHFDYDEDLTVTGSDYLGMKSRRQLYDRPTIYRSSRMLFMEIMDYRTTYSTSLFFTTLQNVTHRLSLQHDHVRPAYAYAFEGNTEFRFTDVIAELRWAPGERFVRSGRTMVSKGTRWPILLGRATWGLNGTLDGEYAYRKLEATLSHDLRLRSWLSLHYQLNGGLLSGNLPYPRMYIFHANGEPNFIAEGNTFNTMFFNDYAAARYFTGHLNFHIENHSFPSRKYNPDARLVLNYGIGDVPTHMQEQNQGGPNKLAPRLGFWETGFALVNLLPRPVVKLVSSLQFMGIGLYYRFGPYAHPNFAGNLFPKAEYRIKF